VAPTAAFAPRRVWSFLAAATVSAVVCLALRGEPLGLRAAAGLLLLLGMAGYAWRVTATAEERRTIVGLVLGRLSASASGQ